MKKIAICVSACALASSALAQLDGLNVGAGLPLVSVQNNQTNFGNSAGGSQDSPGGSELNAAWGTIAGNTLRLSMTGNVEGNFNKMWIFFDAQGGGENILDGANTDGGFNEIQQMTGVQFDNGFSPERALRFEVGGGFLGIRYANLIDNTGGDIFTAGGTGSLPLVNAAGGQGVNIGWDNSNALGVGSGTGVANAADALSATTGWELEIPLDAFLGAAGATEVRIMAFVTSGDGGFASNQFLAGLGGLDNLGDLSNVNFNNIAGDQFFTIVPEPASLSLLVLGAALLRRR